MRAVLTPHPDTPSALTSIDVEISRPSAGQILLRYQATGVLAHLLLPAPAQGRRQGELWKHTCFEAFLREPEGAGYLEFNFSPSTDWAAYAFDGYRSGMRTLQEIGAPAIAVERAPDRLVLQAALRLSMAAPATPLQFALSAVIEQRDGAKSYWALKHPPGKPDFHHPDSFAIELPSPERP